MAHTLPAETDLSQIYSQLSAELAQASDLEAGARSCVAVIEAQLAPRLCQVVWADGHEAQVVAPDLDAPPRHPAPDELALLREGRLVFRMDGDRLAAVFAPLRTRAELLGWLYVDRPAWSLDSAALLTTIAAQAAPVLALLEASNRREDRVAQLQTLNEIGRLLSGVLDLDTLLEAIYNATQRLVDAPGFYIAFYDETSNEFDLAYIVEDGVRQLMRERWPTNVGLAGAIARERRPIVTDDYSCSPCLSPCSSVVGSSPAGRPGRACPGPTKSDPTPAQSSRKGWRRRRGPARIWGQTTGSRPTVSI